VTEHRTTNALKHRMRSKRCQSCHCSRGVLYINSVVSELLFYNCRIFGDIYNVYCEVCHFSDTSISFIISAYVYALCFLVKNDVYLTCIICDIPRMTSRRINAYFINIVGVVALRYSYSRIDDFSNND